MTDDTFNRINADLTEEEIRRVRRANIAADRERLGGCSCGEAYGKRQPDAPKCDYCRLGAMLEERSRPRS